MNGRCSGASCSIVGATEEARLLAAVPFVLGVFLRLLSARALAQFALGAKADAALMGALCLYGAMVIALFHLAERVRLRRALVARRC